MDSEDYNVYMFGLRDASVGSMKKRSLRYGHVRSTADPTNKTTYLKHKTLHNPIVKEQKRKRVPENQKQGSKVYLKLDKKCIGNVNKKGIGNWDKSVSETGKIFGLGRRFAAALLP